MVWVEIGLFSIREEVVAYDLIVMSVLKHGKTAVSITVTI